MEKKETTARLFITESLVFTEKEVRNDFYMRGLFVLRQARGDVFLAKEYIIFLEENQYLFSERFTLLSMMPGAPISHIREADRLIREDFYIADEREEDTREN